ncbi:unnamed protein product [Ambrosiozyma monospora]|uniref:Unnamed protein product n=1 Tax=Ambrosiozyma monospora TaxID=43982 RepID=A0ACB5T2S4_AMBMO|nr:unnamed protein product [Ambrosiozyma monospora]
MLPFKYLGVLASMLVTGAYARDDSIGCYIAADLTPGFVVKLYDYPNEDKTDFTDPAFYGGQYSRTDALGQTTVIDPSFSILPKGETDTIYGIETHVGHFSADLMAYFAPLTSGAYTFSLNSIDDGAMVWLGDNAFDCCDPDNNDNPDNSAGFLLSNEDCLHQPYYSCYIGLYYY